MKHLNAKSFSCYTTPQRQATLVETKPLPRSPVHTGGQGCAHGSRTTLWDVQFANKTKTSPIACAPHYTASHLRRCTPIPTGSAGPHHRITTQRTSRLSADDSRPQMLPSGRLPPLCHDNHGPWGRSAVLRQRVSMVWTAIKDHF